MCIRDRVDLVHDEHLELLRLCVIKQAHQTGPAVDRGGTATVSYTHLRAHETVLDLVCRLLLEKKKMEHSGADAA